MMAASELSRPRVGQRGWCAVTDESKSGGVAEGVLAQVVANVVSRAAKDAVLRHIPRGVREALPDIEREILAALDGVLAGGADSSVVSAGAGPQLHGPLVTPHMAGPGAPVAAPRPVRLAPVAATAPTHEAPAPYQPIPTVLTPGEVAKLRKTGQRRSPEAITALENAVLTVVHATPGLRSAEIAPRIGEGLKPADIRDVNINLVRAGRVSTTGEKHGVRYFPPTAPAAKATAKPAVAKPAKKR